MSVTAPEPLVPELGPLLGRLSVPRGPASGIVPLDDIRLKLVSELFDLAGAAREFAAEGDIPGAVQSLNRQGWLAAWERAVEAAAARVSGRIAARIESAAAEVHLPKKKLGRIWLTEEERRGIEDDLLGEIQLLHEGLRMVRERLESDRKREEELAPLLGELRGVARRLESAWLALEEAAAKEEASWQQDIAEIRRWRRARALSRWKCWKMCRNSIPWCCWKFPPIVDP